MHKIRLKFVISHLPVAGALYSAGQSMILGETWVQGKGIRFIVRYLRGIFTSYWLCNVKCVLSSLTHGFSIKKWGEKKISCSKVLERLQISLWSSWHVVNIKCTSVVAAGVEKKADSWVFKLHLSVSLTTLIVPLSLLFHCAPHPQPVETLELLDKRSLGRW